MKKKNININTNTKLAKILCSNFFKNQRLFDDFHIKLTGKKDWVRIIKKYDFFLNRSLKKEIVPRTIHQIWLGSKVPQKYDKWRKSWMKHNPDFNYILWDEKKILKMGLINEKQFIQTKNFAVKSDIARYEILYNFGGIYVDTDFEALKPIDSKFLTQSLVVGLQFDYSPQIGNAMIIAKSKCNVLKTAINNLPKHQGEMSPLEVMDYCGPHYLTKTIFKSKLPEDILILPSQYFYPWPNFMLHSDKSPYDWVTQNTFGIHHWAVSWSKKSFLIRLFNKTKKLLSN
jgi:mannosyltransferase OCH1-like enzyme